MTATSISVVITCYNLGRYLDEAVQSVLAQTFQDFEVVLVNDGSTDEETRRVLARLDGRRVRVVHSENRGLSAARNLGIAHTTGRYLCMLDADDRLEPSLLEKSVAALESDSGLAFVSHWLRAFGDQEWEWTPSRCDLAALLDANTVNGAALVRRSAVAAVGGFDETMRDGCEDWDLWISLVERGHRGHILPEVLFQYRRRPDSMSRVMMQGEGHPHRYAELIKKHSESFRSNLGSLLTRREGDIVNLRRHIHDLEIEWYREFEPQLAKARDDVAVLERRVGDHERRRVAEEVAVRQALALEHTQARLDRAEVERARLNAILDNSREDHARVIANLEQARVERLRLEAEAGALAAALELATTTAKQLDAEAHRAQHEADALRHSLSWRVTTPLRAAYEFLLRLMSGRK